MGLILFVTAVIFSWKGGKTIAKHLLKEGFLTLAMFNILNISFSAGIHWKYANPEDDGYILSSFCLYSTLIIVSAVIISL